jgi:sugar phosphate isomerase/epimerase
MRDDSGNRYPQSGGPAGRAFDERLAKAAAYGFDGVELMAVEPGRCDGPRMKAAAAKVGLAVSAVASGAVAAATGLTLLAADEETRTAARRRLSELVRLAADIGAPVVTIGSFKGKAVSVGGPVQARRLLAAALKSGAEEASAHSVVLALEPINRYDTDFIHTASEALDFIGSLGCTNVGLLLDTYHMNIEEASFADCLSTVHEKGLLHHVHIGDSNRLPPGRGHIDFTGILATLHSVGYGGFLSAELLGGAAPDAAAQETIEAMRRFEKSLASVKAEPSLD